ncbi:MAG: hypothetical protein ACRDF4_00275 [Rhabdochlamydiaceae bacterium]
MTRSVIQQVTKPAVSIKHNVGETNIYVLRDKTQKFCMPGGKDDSPRAWEYGPLIIIERIDPQCGWTETHHPDSENVWKWLGALIKVGSYAMEHDDTRKLLPEELRF